MAQRLHLGLGLLAGVTGGPASYGRALVTALADLADELRVTVFTDAPDRIAAPGVDVVAVPFRGGLDRLRWQHWALPRALARVRPDVYHDTKNALPFGLRLPAVVTVHDLAYHTVPQTFGFWSRQFLVRATAHAVARAAAVVVPSVATATDLRAVHPACADRVHVVPHGIAPARPVPADELAAVRARLRLPDRYVLHVGTLQARKNVDLLVQGVRQLRAEGFPHRAVLVGRRGWRSEATLAAIAADDTALWLPDVGDQDLPALHAGADAFVSPSAYEGFGLAVADAMAAGVPVVVSNSSSLPEVVGDAGVLLESISAAAITAALRPLLQDAGRRAQLAAAGRARAAGFTWARAAAGHLRAYRQAMAGTR